MLKISIIVTNIQSNETIMAWLSNFSHFMDSSINRGTLNHALHTLKIQNQDKLWRDSLWLHEWSQLQLQLNQNRMITKVLMYWQSYGLIVWFTKWLNKCSDWFTDQLTGWLIDALIDPPSDDSLTDSSLKIQHRFLNKAASPLPFHRVLLRFHTICTDQFLCNPEEVSLK